MSGNQTFSYEDFSLLNCKIESILNSRPLVPVTSSQHTTILTPNHFITERQVAWPLEATLFPNQGPLTRKWLILQQIYEQIWDIFHHEYLMTLQKRAKFQRPIENAKVGQIVLITDVQAKPCEWNMGNVSMSDQSTN